MKKLIVLVITLTLTLLLSSCNIQLYKLPHDAFCYSDTDTVVELKIEEKEYIINLLNEGKWHPDVAKCTTDYNFYTQKQSLGYNAEEGIFNDFTLSRSLKLSEEDRIAVNLYLGYKDADETPFTPSPDKTYSFDDLYNLSGHIDLNAITEVRVDSCVASTGWPILHDVSIMKSADRIAEVVDFIKNAQFIHGGELLDGGRSYNIILVSDGKEFDFTFFQNNTFEANGFFFSSSSDFPILGKYSDSYMYFEALNEIKRSSFGEITTLTNFNISDIWLSHIFVDPVGPDFRKHCNLIVDDVIIGVRDPLLIEVMGYGYFTVVGEKNFSEVIPDGVDSTVIRFDNDAGQELGRVIVSLGGVYTLDELRQMVDSITWNLDSFEIYNSDGTLFTDREFTEFEIFVVKATE